MGYELVKYAEGGETLMQLASPGSKKFRELMEKGGEVILEDIPSCIGIGEGSMVVPPEKAEYLASKFLLSRATAIIPSSGLFSSCRVNPMPAPTRNELITAKRQHGRNVLFACILKKKYQKPQGAPSWVKHIWKLEQERLRGRQH